MANANQPFNYNEDLSEGTLSNDESETKQHMIYSTTNILSPANQPINEIIVEILNEDQVN
jgi:hypothetical protein